MAEWFLGAGLWGRSVGGAVALCVMLPAATLSPMPESTPERDTLRPPSSPSGKGATSSRQQWEPRSFCSSICQQKGVEGYNRRNMGLHLIFRFDYLPECQHFLEDGNILNFTRTFFDWTIIFSPAFDICIKKIHLDHWKLFFHQNCCLSCEFIIAQTALQGETTQHGSTVGCCRGRCNTKPDRSTISSPTGSLIKCRCTRKIMQSIQK